MVRAQKIYAGVKLREARLKTGKTQKDFATSLGVSLSYLNQMERNHRPLSAAVVLQLVQEFGFDVRTLSGDEANRLVVDLAEAFADPLFAGTRPQEEDMRLIASNAPSFAHSLLALYRAHRETSERFSALDEALGEQAHDLAATPWEEVRDFFHYCDNYIDAVDRAAETFATSSGFLGRDKLEAGAKWLEDHHDISVDLGQGPLRHFDPKTKRLHISKYARRQSQAFQVAHQIALLSQSELIEATLDLGPFRSEEARAVAKIGLANYFAGAAILPYGAFRDAALELRHDLEALSFQFDASIEQVAQRLSTLQRPDHKGVPFFFVRVDRAGTITKRHSATKLQFARYGGACPLWNVHAAFETPGRFLRQLAETPDGLRYLCLARDVSKAPTKFGAPVQRFAIGLGCEIQYAKTLVYADDMDLDNMRSYAPIGVSCRICERANCHQRSVPPMHKTLQVNHNTRSRQPYELD